MNILYIDEYGEELFRGDGDIIPAIGDTVSLQDEDWRVRSRTFIPIEKGVVVELTQNLVKSKASDEGEGRLAEMQQSIMQLRTRQDQSERRSTRLREQLVSVRTYLRTQARTTK